MKRIALLFLVLISLPAFAQNSRGSITGQITDPSGAVIPQGVVTVTDTDTGAVSQVTSSGGGFYTAPGLQPGPYKISVDAKGFKKFTQSGIHVSTQENATVNIKLTIGGTEETVTVSSDAPLIDIADASTGQVLTSEQVASLPSDGGSPLGFARIEYGVVSKGKHALGGALPYNNSTVDDFSLGGGNSSSNELLLDGVNNMQDSTRTAGFSPALDSVNEVRVDVFGANASYGDTSGGTVNITTKGGTNTFHGSGAWLYQAAGCSALYGAFVDRGTNHCSPFTALPWSQKAGAALPPATHQNQFNGTIGGPVWIPGIFNGRDKLFFFYAYEKVKGQSPPATTIGSVPTQAERNGDFSALLGLGVAYQLYNPYAAVASGSNVTRSAIPGNCLVATCGSTVGANLQLNPIAQAYLKSVPLPNYSGPTTTADGQNNYFTYTPTVVNYTSNMGRVDYNFGPKNKMWGTAHRSKYLVTQSNYFHNQLSGSIADQITAGGLLEDVQTFTPTLFLDVRGSVTRYDNHSTVSSTGTSPSTLGFPGYLSANSTSIALPQITFTDSTNPLGYSSQPGSGEDFDTVALFATLTKIHGPHSFQIGTDIRAYKGSYITPGATNGTFSFAKSNGNPVAASNTATPATFGSSYALFLLGIPNGGSYNIAAPFQFNSWLDAFFLQDDWKAKPNLTISTGIRFEHELPVVESQNRMVNGFDPTIINQATAPAQANYAAHPGSLLAAASFLPTGGAIYASSSNRAAYSNPPLYVSPRIGISWAPDALHQKGVIRLGYGIYTNPFNDFNQGQSYGYSQSTPYVQTSNTGLTNGVLSDPFPTANPILQPTGNALGANVNLGSKMVYYYPRLKVPYSERTSVDFQYQIGRTIVIDLGYINNHQVHLSYSNAVGSVPLLPYLSRSPYYDPAVTNLLTGATFKNGGPATTNITNPFLGVAGITGSLSTAKTIAPNTYLQANPEYSSLTEQLIPGSSSNYNALNARVSKTMGHGLDINGVFEWSRLLGTFNQLNPGDVVNYGETTSDYPFHFSGYGTYQLPFGHGRQFFHGNRYLDPVIGGWQVSAIYQFLSGTPMSWNNVIYTGSGFKDFHNVQHSSANVFGQPVFNTSVFDTRSVVNSAYPVNNDPTNVTAATPYNPNIQPTGNNYRTFPQYLLRQDYTSNWDGNVQKNTRLAENVVLQLRLDLFNLLNRPQYNTPSVSPTSAAFGTSSGVYSGTGSRKMQLSAHIAF
ncbi:MAG: carboxypeptidase-like regulatory domain-containing protein [Acidobacteriota bacterium]|nr:carboxypeptidase-like regulatory domain-containing protein [Acidobacteriota bacterium]